MAAPLIPIALGIAKYVPSIVKYFVGDKEADAAKRVVDIAKSVVGGQPEGIEEKLKNDPKLIAKLEVKFLEHEAEMDALYLEDKKNARKRDITLHKMGYKNTRADIMVLVVGIALCLDIYLIWSTPEMPAGVLAIFNMMIGSLLKMLGDAFSFEFGSSRGSKEKDAK